MSNFFVTKDIHKARLEVCRSCEHYLPLLGNCKICGCFMRIKSSISNMSCADTPKKWDAVKSNITNENLPQDLIDEVLEYKDQIISQRLKDHDTKKRVIELYNTIYNGRYKTTTNCSTCMKNIHHGLMQIIKKHG